MIIHPPYLENFGGSVQAPASRLAFAPLHCVEGIVRWLHVRSSTRGAFHRSFETQEKDLTAFETLRPGHFNLAQYFFSKR